MHPLTSQGDHAFALLWLASQRSVEAYIYARVRDIHLTEDLMQEVALAAQANFDHFDPEREFTAWLLGIARNKIADHWRVQSGSPISIHPETERLLRMASQDLAEEISERHAVMRDCVGQLPEHLQTILHAHYIEGDPLTAIADRMQLKLTTVKVRLHRIRKQLRHCMLQKLNRNDHP